MIDSFRQIAKRGWGAAPIAAPPTLNSVFYVLPPGYTYIYIGREKQRYDFVDRNRGFVDKSRGFVEIYLFRDCR